MLYIVLSAIVNRNSPFHPVKEEFPGLQDLALKRKRCYLKKKIRSPIIFALEQYKR